MRPRPGALLILGAGEEQLPLFREARRRGLPTIAVDQRSDRPALPLADTFLQISTRDHAAIAAALGAVEPAGVVSAGSDVCLLSWHELSRRYRTPHVFPRVAAVASMDKAAFHEVVRAAELPGYRWVALCGPDERAALAAGLRFPVIVKPTDASGSKGTTLVEDRAGLSRALAHAAVNSFAGDVIVEEFIVGRNLTVEVFLRDGEAIFSVVTEKRIVPGPNFVIGGHTCPAPLERPVRARVVETAVRLCAAMDFTAGPAHFDVILAPDGTPYMLEVGARMCGNGYPRLMRALYGVDTVAALVALALGEPYDLRPSGAGHGIIHVLASPASRDGVLLEVQGLHAVQNLPGVADAELVARAGEVVRPFTQSGNKLGYVVVTGGSPAEAETVLARALSALHLDVAPIDAACAAEGEFHARH
jgi:biotin carboxylase